MSKQLREEVTMEGNSLRVIEAKSGNLIPVLNNHSLHSTLDPINEAKLDVQNKIDAIKKANIIIVLGLGFGYHVDEIRKANPDAIVWVIEPNINLIQEYLSQDIHPVDAKIHCEPSIDQLFKTDHFIQLLLNKPTIYCHKNSVEANGDYFKKFLNYQAPKFCTDYLESIDYNLRGYFDNEIVKNDSATLKDIIDSKVNTRKLIKDDFFVLALNSILDSSI